MSNVSKIRRLLQLIELLQSGRSYNARQLAELGGISRRQVFRDLRMLQDSGIPLMYDAERQGYWLSATTYLPPTDLTLAETMCLIALAADLGRAREGIPFQRAARDAAIKLLSNLPGHLRKQVGELTAAVDMRADAHHLHDASQGEYELLLQAVRERRRIRIRYHSLFERAELTTLFSPYRLLFVRRAWYAIGRSSVHRSVRTFHVGRIRQAELTDDRYDVPPRFTLERYLGNAWLLVRERGKSRTVRVRFQPKVADNVAEVAWHKTQRTVWNDDGTLDFSVTVDGLSEISWWVLGYGDQAVVLEPAELRELIAGHAARLVERYRGNGAPRKG